MSDLTITLLQTELAWHEPATNRARLAALADEIGEPTDLLILPEMFTTGFTMETATLAEPMDGPSVAWMQSLAISRDFVVTGSLVIDDGGRYFNRLIWARPDGTLGSYDKRHLFRMAGEHEHFAPGTERAQFDIRGWRICPLICYDLRFPVWSRGANQFDLLLYVANWPAARQTAWRTLLPARAVENQCYVAGVNRIGIDGKGVRYVGGSGAWNHLGQPEIDCGDGADVASVRLDRGELDRYREKFPAWMDADRFELL